MQAKNARRRSHPITASLYGNAERILGLRRVLIQFVQRRTNSGNHKAGKGAILSLDRLLNLLDNIRRKTDRFINSRRILRNFEFSHKQHTPHCKCIAYSLLANCRNLCIAFAMHKQVDIQKKVGDPAGSPTWLFYLISLPSGEMVTMERGIFLPLRSSAVCTA